MSVPSEARSPTGRRVDLHMHSTASDGALAGVVLAFRDRTEEWTARARLEEEVVRSRQSEEKYRELIEDLGLRH